MYTDYYSIPAAFGSIIKLQPLEKISLEESVYQNIALFLNSKPGEYHFDPAYGCILFNFDFVELTTTSKKDEIKRTVEAYLRNFDKRIEIDSVAVDVFDQSETVKDKVRTSRRIRIVVRSKLTRTKEPLAEMKFEVIRYS